MVGLASGAGFDGLSPSGRWQEIQFQHPLILSLSKDQYICCPPLMLSVEPVTNPPFSEHRKFTPRAISLA